MYKANKWLLDQINIERWVTLDSILRTTYFRGWMPVNLVDKTQKGQFWKLFPTFVNLKQISVS